MSYRTERFNDAYLDKIFKILLDGLEENAGLDDKRKIVNSILPVKKYKLLERFLSKEENLSYNDILNCLPIFLDERTFFIGFERVIFDQEIVKSILDIIPRCSPNIETVDFRNLFIDLKNKENFKTFLKQTTQLKSLRMNISPINCSICELLLEDDFNLHEQGVQNGLLKIEYMEAILLDASICAELLKLLPNLKSFGMMQDLSVMLPLIRDDDEIAKKISNLTEFSDSETSLTTLECFSKCCPNTKTISLDRPEKNAIENLSKFPLLTEIVLDLEERLDLVSELVSVLKQMGNQIKILSLNFDSDIVLAPNILYDLCPELIKFEINYETYYLN